MTAAAPVSLPQVSHIGLGGWAAWVALALALGAGLVCGLPPALMGTRAPYRSLREGGPALTHSRRESRWRVALAVAQIAIAFVLVCGAGLLVRSFVAAESGGAGVENPGAVLTASLPLPAAQYSTARSEQEFFQRLQALLAAEPGVTGAAAATDLPTQTDWNRIFAVEHQPPSRTLPFTSHTLTLGEYFRTAGIPLLQGRDFTAAERQGKANVVIVSAALAARYWPRGEALGHRLKWGESTSHTPWLTVVGVVGDVKPGPLDEPARFHTYAPFAQECQGSNPNGLCRGLNLVVQSGRPGMAERIRAAVRQIDPAVPVSQLRTMAAVLADSLTPRRFNTTLIASFGAAALLLAAVGLYGVLAFMVAGQRREIGVRMALGAAPAAILALVLRRGLAWAAAGLGAGALTAWALSRYIRGLLYQTSASDPATWLGVAALLALVALAAGAIPALRASRVSPAVTLRD
ncbi:MAG: ABC transporter permease, partial [Terriglobales bacterium]